MNVRLYRGNLNWIPVLMLILSSLACYQEEHFGTLPPLSLVDCMPITFGLRGEVDAIWQLNVKPGVQYEVTISKEPESLHPIQSISITVGKGIDNIASEIEVSQEEGSARVIFTAPKDGQVALRVYSLVGGDQSDLGTHTLVVCQIK